MGAPCRHVFFCVSGTGTPSHSDHPHSDPPGTASISIVCSRRMVYSVCVCVADRRCLISNVFVTFSHDVDRTRIKLFSCQLASVFYLKRGCFSKSVAETKKSTKSLTKKIGRYPYNGVKNPLPQRRNRR